MEAIFLVMDANCKQNLLWRTEVADADQLAE